MDKNYIKIGKICGDKWKYKDGVGCCIWYPFEDDESSGCCWDFAFEDIDDLIELLKQLKNKEPEIYQENDS